MFVVQVIVHKRDRVTRISCQHYIASWGKQNITWPKRKDCSGCVRVKGGPQERSRQVHYSKYNSSSVVTSVDVSCPLHITHILLETAKHTCTQTHAYTHICTQPRTHKHTHTEPSRGACHSLSVRLILVEMAGLWKDSSQFQKAETFLSSVDMSPACSCCPRNSETETIWRLLVTRLMAFTALCKEVIFFFFLNIVSTFSMERVNEELLRLVAVSAEVVFLFPC